MKDHSGFARYAERQRRPGVPQGSTRRAVADSGRVMTAWTADQRIGGGWRAAVRIADGLETLGCGTANFVIGRRQRGWPSCQGKTARSLPHSHTFAHPHGNPLTAVHGSYLSPG